MFGFSIEICVAIVGYCLFKTRFYNNENWGFLRVLIKIHRYSYTFSLNDLNKTVILLVYMACDLLRI